MFNNLEQRLTAAKIEKAKKDGWPVFFDEITTPPMSKAFYDAMMQKSSK